MFNFCAKLCYFYIGSYLAVALEVFGNWKSSSVLFLSWRVRFWGSCICCLGALYMPSLLAPTSLFLPLLLVFALVVLVFASVAFGSINISSSEFVRCCWSSIPVVSRCL